MREGRPGRGERVRVARRVRAVLAERADVPAAGGPVPAWLPGADFGVPASSEAGSVAPVPVPPVRPVPPGLLAPGLLATGQRVPRPPGPSARSRGMAAQGVRGLLAALRPGLAVRADPGRRGAVAVGIAVLIAAVLTGAWVLSSRPHAIAVTGTRADPASVASARAAASTAGSLTPDPAPARVPATATPLVVDVAGRVRHPGLYHLPAGSRIADAVRVAGGALPGVDLTNLNLAAKLADGQQITVGVPGAVAGGAAGSTGSAATAGPVDLNSATIEQLETLPGVGPVLGQHIIDWRTAHGRFATVDQLRDVPGIATSSSPRSGRR